MDLMTGKMFTASPDTKIAMLIGIVLCPAYVLHGKMTALKRTQLLEKGSSKIVAIVKFLSQRGLAFRGHNEVYGSNNNGNFLGIIELLAQFDPFIADHVSRYCSAGRSNVSYLSSTICNEFIELMAKNVFSNNHLWC